MEAKDQVGEQATFNMASLFYLRLNKIMFHMSEAAMNSDVIKWHSGLRELHRNVAPLIDAKGFNSRDYLIKVKQIVETPNVHRDKKLNAIKNMINSVKKLLDEGFIFNDAFAEVEDLIFAPLYQVSNPQTAMQARQMNYNQAIPKLDEIQKQLIKAMHAKGLIMPRGRVRGLNTLLADTGLLPD